METASTVVIKVKYGDVLRRFSARVVGEKMDLSFDGLREKIFSLFRFSADTELELTYIDEDKEDVALVDDEDLLDVVKQGLDPVRITVKLKTEKSEKIGGRPGRSRGSSNPPRSPSSQQSYSKSDRLNIPVSLDEALLKLMPDLESKSSSAAPGTTQQVLLQDLNSGLAEILRAAQKPLRGALLNLATDVASKSATSVPCIADIVDNFAKVGLSYLEHLDTKSKEQPSLQDDAPESCQVAAVTKGLGQLESDAAPIKVQASGEQPIECTESSEKSLHESIVETNKVKSGPVSSSSKVLASNAVPSVGSKTRTTITGKKKVVVKSSSGVPDEKSKTTPAQSFVGSIPLTVGNSIPSELKVNKPEKPNTEPKITNAVLSDYMKSRQPSQFFPGSSSGPSCASRNDDLTLTFQFPDLSYLKPVESMAGAHPQPVSKNFPEVGGLPYVGSGVTYHHGVCCDGCGMHPISGPRFKSKVREDHDLCNLCFDQIGKSEDYIKMDHPATCQTIRPCKELFNSAHHAGPQVAQGGRFLGASSGTSMLNSRFIQDVNIFDGTIMAPLTAFTKIWRIRNNGMVVWPKKTRLVWIGGDRLCKEFSFELEIPEIGIQVDQELDVAIDFIAPELPGQYVSYWKMSSPSGEKFGQRFWVLIQVDASLKETELDTAKGFNLNSLPAGDEADCPAAATSNGVEPMVEGHLDSVKMMGVSFQHRNQPQLNVEHEKKFSINDNLMVDTGTSSSSSSLSSSISNHLKDNTHRVQALRSRNPVGDYTPLTPWTIPPPPPSALPPPQPAVVNPAPPPESFLPPPWSFPPHIPGRAEMERLLKAEYENKSFNQGHLTESMRLNDYDLKKNSDFLFRQEWYPMLDELQGMGFTDTEMNKMLLKKNNGSIKRVVMDLLSKDEN